MRERNPCMFSFQYFLEEVVPLLEKLQVLGSNVEGMQKKEMYTPKAHACVYKPGWDRVLRSPALDCNFRIRIKLHPV